MLVYLCKKEEEFSVTEFINCTFDGSSFRTYLNGNLVFCHPASVGECIYVTPRGQSKPPIVTKAEIPKSRGARIAWALSFIGDEKYAKSESDFFEKYKKLSANSSYKNALYEYEKGVFAFMIADKVVSSKDGDTPRVKTNKPILAWISDDISDDNVSKLCTIFAKYHLIHCPPEFLNLK